MSYLPQTTNHTNYLDWIIQAHEERARHGLDTFELDAGEYVIYPHVFNPNIATSSKLFANHILQLDLSGKRVMDAGCGCGILTIAALRAGAEYVYSFDRNPQAVANTLDNLERLPKHSGSVEVHCTNQLPDDQGPFDYIFCNPPFFRSEAGSTWQYAITDSAGSLAEQLLQQINALLDKGGKLVLALGGDLGRSDAAKQLKKQRFEHLHCIQLSGKGLPVWLLEGSRGVAAPYPI